MPSSNLKLPIIMLREQGWRSGDSTRLPPTWPGLGPRVGYVGCWFFTLLDPRGFSLGSPVFPSSKINISKFQFDRMQDLPENHYRVRGASWGNINNYYYLSNEK